jgi:hypothetical protein
MVKQNPNLKKLIASAERIVSDYNYRNRKKFGIKEYFVLENAKREIVYSGKSYDVMTRKMQAGNGISYCNETYRSYEVSVQNNTSEIQIIDWNVIRYEESESIEENGKNVMRFPSDFGIETLEKILQGYNPKIKLAIGDPHA